MKQGRYVGCLITLSIFFLLTVSYSARPTLTYHENGIILNEKSKDWEILKDGLPQNYALINNVWNKGAAGPGPSEQIIFTEIIKDKFAFGWKWNWPMGRGFVVAYPEVVYGTKPWDIDKPYELGGNMPFKAGSKKLTAKFNINLQASGTYNMAFSMWAIADPNAPKASITHEIMIWNANNGLTPAGKKQGTLQVNGVRFDVYIKPGHTDDSGANDNSWTYIAFAAQKPVLRGSLDLSDFITYLLKQGILTPDNYITAVELGNEIVGGTGLVEITDYLIEVEH